MLTKKLLRKKASLQDIYRLYQVVVRIPKLTSILSELDNVTVKNVLLTPMKDVLEVCPLLYLNEIKEINKLNLRI